MSLFELGNPELAEVIKINSGLSDAVLGQKTEKNKLHWSNNGERRKYYTEFPLDYKL